MCGCPEQAKTTCFGGFCFHGKAWFLRLRLQGRKRLRWYPMLAVEDCPGCGCSALLSDTWGFFRWRRAGYADWKARRR